MADAAGESRPISHENRARFARTSALPGISDASLRAVLASRVLVVGAGGLGSPVLQYLAALGVGTLGIVDFDTVDLSNLQRQVIHGSGSLGQLKTESAALAITALNPGVVVVQHPARLHRENALEILGEYDIVVDASDNFATRYLASDAAAILRLPYVWGSVLQFDGQVAVFWEGSPLGVSLDYRDLHPVPPDPALVLSCSEAGVLGSLCGTIGTMMATEVFKLITGVGVPLIGRVQNLDAMTGTWREFELRRAPERMPVTELIDYDDFCGLTASVAEAPSIGRAELAGSIAQGATLIDVREAWEHEGGHIAGDVLIPFATLLASPELAGSGPVVIYCATGARSSRAARELVQSGVDAVTLRGGYNEWRAG